MLPIRAFESTTGPRPRRLLGGIAVSAAAHAIVALLLVFDVLGPGGGFGLGIGPGFGIGAGGGAGLGEARRREIFSLQDLPTPTPPSDPTPDKTLHELLAPTTNPAVVVPHQAPAPVSTPVVHFARPVRPIGSGIDLGSRFASSGAGLGGLGLGSCSLSASFQTAKQIRFPTRDESEIVVVLIAMVAGHVCGETARHTLGRLVKCGRRSGETS